MDAPANHLQQRVAGGRIPARETYRVLHTHELRAARSPRRSGTGQAHACTRHPQPAVHPLPVRRGMVPPLCARIAPPRLLPEARTGGKRVLHRGRGGDAELHPCHQPRHRGDALREPRKAEGQEGHAGTHRETGTAVWRNGNFRALRRKALHRHTDAAEHHAHQGELHVVRTDRMIFHSPQITRIDIFIILFICENLCNLW